MTTPTALSGPLWKKGGKRTNWLQRHFTLFNGALCYYASKETKTPKGFILTKDITDVRAAEGKVGKKSGKGEFAFEVITKLRTYYFAPTTSELRDEWIAAVKTWIGFSEEDVSTKELPEPGASTREAKPEEAAATEAKADDAAKTDDAAAATDDAAKTDDAAATTDDAAAKTDDAAAAAATDDKPADAADAAAAAAADKPADDDAAATTEAKADEPAAAAATDAAAEAKTDDAAAAEPAAADAAAAPAADAAAAAAPAADAAAEAKSDDAAPAKAEDGKEDEDEDKMQLYECQYDYDAQEDNELSFKEGDVVTVLDKFRGAGWWKAELNGKVGLIPNNFVTPKSS